MITIQTQRRGLQQRHGEQDQVAATVISQIPVLLLFVVGQRYFVQSIANTGIK